MKAVFVGLLSGVLLIFSPVGSNAAQNGTPAEASQAVAQSSWIPVQRSAAETLARTVRIDLTRVRVRDALEYLADRADLRIAYGDDVLSSAGRVSLHADGIRVVDALTTLLEGTGLEAYVTRQGDALLVRRGRAMRSDSEVEGLTTPVGSIAGRVTDAVSGDGISGARVFLDETRFDAVTGEGGRYRIVDVPAGTYRAVVQQVGYAESGQSVRVIDGGETSADFALEVSALPLDEIVATGTAFETRVRTTPNPISVITARDIEAKGASNITDLIRGEIPGVMALSSGQNDFSSQIFVRGNSAWTTDDVVKIYIDGVEVANPVYISTIDPKAIERIELVRGPQSSTIYGSEAASGVLQVFTKKGSMGLDRPRIEVQVAGGTIESDYTPDGSTPATQDHSVAVTGGSDAFSYRAGASYTTVGEWLKHYGSETMSFSAGLRATQGPLTAELTALWSDRDFDYSNSPIFQRWPASDACRQCGNPDLVYPNHDYALSQNTVGLNLRYLATPRWQHNLILGDDQNRFGYHQVEPHRLAEADTFVILSNEEYRRRSVRYSTAYETALSGSVTGRITAGIDYWSYDVQGSTGRNLLESFGTVETGPETSATFENDRWWNLGYFGLVELGLNDQLHLTLATRIEENPHLGDEYGSAVSPRVGASYTRDLGSAALKLRAQYGKGVRTPPVYAGAGQVSTSSVILPNSELGPEEKVGWDAGVDVYWGRRASFSLTRYDEEGRNLIQAVDLDLTAVPIVRQYQNIGRVESSGWEAEGMLDLGRVTLRANYAYADNTIKELSNQYTATPNQVFQVGDRMAAVPKHSGGGTLTTRLGPWRASVNASVMSDWRNVDWVAFYGWLYGGEEYRGSTRAYYMDYPALWKWNLHADRTLADKLTLFLRIDNLTNEQAADIYNLHVSPGRAVMVGARFVY